MFSVLAVLAATKARDIRQPTNMSVLDGETAFFNCTGDTVRWLRFNHSIGENMKIFTSSPLWNKDSTKYEIVGKYDLIIKGARINSDAGRYSCDTSDSVFIHRTYLTVIGNVSTCCI